MNGNVTVILRGYNLEQVRSVCNVLLKSSKVKNVEITLNTKNAYNIISEIVSEFQSKLNIGAGTVITFDELKKVVDLGVKFVLSPVGFTKEMIDYCHKNDVLAIPSGLTPTEIYQQFSMGADIVKVFPANVFSENYAKKVLEPLGYYPLMAVGGVNAQNVKNHFDGGYSYVGTCHGLFKASDIENKNENGMLVSLREFEEAM